MEILTWVCLLAAGAAQASSVESLTSIESAQLLGSGFYDVLCSDGTHETVTADDIRANQVCPALPMNLPISEMVSIQRRLDSSYLVKCRDSRVVDATLEEVMADTACDVVPDVLESGRFIYQGSDSWYCGAHEVTANHSDARLTDLRVELSAGCSSSGTFTCTDNVCTGSIPGASGGTRTITVVSSTEYTYEVSGHAGVARFLKEGSFAPESLPQRVGSRTPGEQN